MAQKRQQQALPIFNRGKRPRLALVAHPGNTNLKQPPSEPLSWSNAKSTYNWQPSNRTGCEVLSENYQCKPTGYRMYESQDQHVGNSSASYPRPQLYQTKQATTHSSFPAKNSWQNMIDTPATCYQQQSYSSSMNSHHQQQRQPNSTGYHPKHQPAPQAQKNTNQPVGSCSQLPPQNSGFIPYPKRSQPVTHSSTKPTSVSVGTTPPGHAAEPVEKAHGAQTGGPPTGIKKTKPSLRLLTATAQGMKHWARYKTHTPLLFEVFGRLLSPGVTSQSSSCKRFTIQTSDGPVSCQFWEIDRPLPHLSVGGGYRVVGQWDDKVGVIKCFSVRSVRVGELESVGPAVEWTDRAMRKFVSSLSET